jgi:nicotinate phosphoribosyltransferase
MADTKAPIDLVGTGSFIPRDWAETYATADIVAYGNDVRVKVGREFLLSAHQKREHHRRSNGVE